MEDRDEQLLFLALEEDRSVTAQADRSHSSKHAESSADAGQAFLSEPSHEAPGWRLMKTLRSLFIDPQTSAFGACASFTSVQKFFCLELISNVILHVSAGSASIRFKFPTSILVYFTSFWPVKT